ncbi:MAG: AIM24 family protein [Clostridia bacterium]|nr:AIM24 family protein [Clostridia bacterium]
MVNVTNYFDNPNIKLIDQQGSMRVFEIQKDYTMNPQAAPLLYYCDQMGVRRRQAVIELQGSSCILSSGAMQWTAGAIEAQTDIKGVGDLFGKMVKGAVTNESAVKPLYKGTGLVVLEPTYKFLFIQNVEDWNGGLVVDDGMFLACEGTVEQKIARRTNLSSAVLSGEGIFNLCLKGKGLALLESPVPPSELIEINLENDTIKIDGNFAVAWSNTLTLTTERSSKSLIGSTVTGEGLVNVFRGTGKILMAPVR